MLPRAAERRAPLPSMSSEGSFLALAGPSALSAFRAEQLLARIRMIEPAAHDVDARFIHFVHATRALEPHEQVRLNALLTYGEAVGEEPSLSRRRR